MVEGTKVVHVLAMITAKPGMRHRILEIFRANMPAVHAEDGCIEYAPTIDLVEAEGLGAALGEDSFIVVEKWADLAALKAHAAAPHMVAYAAKTRDLIAKRVIHILGEA